jgi:hypothetical protein
VVRIQVEFFWLVMRCSVIVGYYRFGEPYCHHPQGEDVGSMVHRSVGTKLHDVTIPMNSTFSIGVIHVLMGCCVKKTEKDSYYKEPRK